MSDFEGGVPAEILARAKKDAEFWKGLLITPNEVNIAPNGPETGVEVEVLSFEWVEYNSGYWDSYWSVAITDKGTEDLIKQCAKEGHWKGRGEMLANIVKEGKADAYIHAFVYETDSENPENIISCYRGWT